MSLYDICVYMHALMGKDMCVRSDFLCYEIGVATHGKLCGSKLQVPIAIQESLHGIT